MKFTCNPAYDFECVQNEHYNYNVTAVTSARTWGRGRNREKCRATIYVRTYDLCTGGGGQQAAPRE